jgi:hypothetical protein
MGFGRRFLIIVTSIVVIVDFAELYVVNKDPFLVTPAFTLAIIIATIVPILINLWYLIPKYKLKW